MSRVRVIKDGKVIGSLPAHRDGGHSGALAAVYRLSGPPGDKMISMGFWPSG
jgi:hypothetical protein